MKKIILFSIVVCSFLSTAAYAYIGNTLEGDDDEEHEYIKYRINGDLIEEWRMQLDSSYICMKHYVEGEASVSCYYSPVKTETQTTQEKE